MADSGPRLGALMGLMDANGIEEANIFLDKLDRHVPRAVLYHVACSGFMAAFFVAAKMAVEDRDTLVALYHDLRASTMYSALEALDQPDMLDDFRGDGDGRTH